MVVFFAKFADDLTGGCGWAVWDDTDENRRPDGFDDILPKMITLNQARKIEISLLEFNQKFSKSSEMR